MSNLVLSNREKDVKKLIDSITDLMYDSGLFDISDPEGIATGEVISAMEDGVSSMFDKVDKSLLELEEDVYYRSDSWF